MVKHSLGPLGPKEKIAAAGLYENMTVTLQDHPGLALRLRYKSVEALAEREMEEMMKKLTPLQRRRFQKRLGNPGDEAEDQGVA